MDYEVGAIRPQRCNRDIVAVLGAIAFIALAACGSSGRLSSMTENWKQQARSPHEEARDERARAVARANAALETARDAGAEWASPYDYYLAEEFLALAREELGSGDVGGVVRFAAESEKHTALAMQMVKAEKPKEVRP